jgi:hypothetical protein
MQYKINEYLIKSKDLKRIVKKKICRAKGDKYNPLSICTIENRKKNLRIDLLKFSN